MRDLEDALQASAAVAFHADFVTSRNARDYKNSPAPTITPREFSARISTMANG